MGNIPKDWYKSKTVWFGLIWIVATVLTSSGVFVPSKDMTELAAAFAGVLVVVLRMLTSQPIGKA